MRTARGKNLHAVALAKRRLVTMTPARRRAVARQAVQARWARARQEGR
jgi:hypothetical protein